MTNKNPIVISIEEVQGDEFLMLRRDLGYCCCISAGRIMEAMANGNVTVKTPTGCITKHISEFEVVFPCAKNINYIDDVNDFEDYRDIEGAIIAPKKIIKNLKRMSFNEQQHAINSIRDEVEDENQLEAIETETGNEHIFVDELKDIQDEIEDEIMNEEITFNSLMDSPLAKIFTEDHISRIASFVVKYKIDLFKDKDLFEDLMLNMPKHKVPFVRNISVEVYDFTDDFFRNHQKRLVDNLIYFIMKYKINVIEDELLLLDLLPQ